MVVCDYESSENGLFPIRRLIVEISYSEYIHYGIMCFHNFLSKMNCFEILSSRTHKASSVKTFVKSFSL
uniref:Uncharacterized protein n=1 Tax=Rhizophora mucronata TaxID=61149 RepID=A0A2P2PMV4_RHIMU